MHFKQAIKRSWRSFMRVFPGLIGIMILISLFNTFVEVNFFKNYFQESFLGPFVGALFGSIAAGSPAINYLLSGDLLHEGFSLIIVTAFMMTWGSVNIVQFPDEVKYLGNKFTLARNLLAFIFSLAIAYLTIFLTGL